MNRCIAYLCLWVSLRDSLARPLDDGQKSLVFFSQLISLESHERNFHFRLTERFTSCECNIYSRFSLKCCENDFCGVFFVIESKSTHSNDESFRKLSDFIRLPFRQYFSDRIHKHGKRNATKHQPTNRMRRLFVFFIFILFIAAEKVSFVTIQHFFGVAFVWCAIGRLPKSSGIMALNILST